MKVLKRGLTFLLVALIVTAFFAGCASSAQPAAPSSASNAEAPSAAPAASGAASSDTSSAEPAAAGTNPQVKEFKGSPDEVYYMNVMVSGVEYWFPVYEMFKQCGQQLGVKTVYGGTPEYDVNLQIASFEQVLAMKPAGIYVHPMNADAFIEPINKAIDSGVAIATFAADSPKSKRRVYITSDNVNEGNVASDIVCKEIGGSGEIACTENPGQSNHDLYIKSFIANVEKNYPDVKIVNRTATNQDTAKAYEAALATMQANPNLKAYITPEAPSAQGVAQAVKEKGANIMVLTRDLNVTILDAIKAGEIWGAVNPDQGNQGYMGMLCLFLLKHSDMIDPMSDYELKGVSPINLPFVDNGMNMVTKENADYFYWDKYLASRPWSKGIEE